MTLDYKIITEVLQLEKDGFNDLEIASELGLDSQELIEHDVSTLEAIEDLVEEGITNSAEIAENLNLPVDYITEIASEYGLKEVKISKDNRIRFLKRRRGLMLREKQEQKDFKKRKRKSKKNLKQEVEEVPVNAKIDLLVMEGTDFSVMESASGLESKEVRNYLKATNQYELWETRFSERTGIQITEPFKPKIKKPKTGKRQPKGTIRHPEIDTIVDDGLSLGEMRILGNFSNQSGPRNYLVTTGQHARWKVARNKKLGIKPKEPYQRIPAVDAIIENTGTLDEMKEAGGWPTAQGPTAYMIKTTQYTRWKTRTKQFEQEKPTERKSRELIEPLPEIETKQPVESKRKKKPKTETPRDPDIDALIPKGLTLKVMAEICEKSRASYIFGYLNETNQHSTWKAARLAKKETPRNPDLDKLVEEGTALRKIKGIEGYESHEKIRQYIIKTHQHKKWKSARKKPKLEKQQRESAIRNVIKLAQKDLYQESNRVEQKVFEFFMSARHRRILPEQVRTICTRYFEAKDAGKKLSLEKLGEGLHLCIPEIGRILKDARLEPLFGKKERHMTPQWKKEAIKRAFPLDVNPPDIAYFLELPEHIVYQNMKIIGPRPKRQEFIAEPLANTGLPDLNYRLASQIYEARDLKFEIQEIVELLDMRKTVINYILKNETIISPKIFDILKTLYPEKNITTPYIQTKQND